MFQEYPKCLCKGEEIAIVWNAEEEAEKRQDGYRMAAEEKAPEPAKRKPGRPRKQE